MNTISKFTIVNNRFKKENYTNKEKVLSFNKLAYQTLSQQNSHQFTADSNDKNVQNFEGFSTPFGLNCK